MMPKALIFDVDGTLSETEDVHLHAFNDTFDAFGLELGPWLGLGLDPRDCVARKDSRNGLISAKAAGLPCVVSPSAYTNDAEFPEADAVVACFTQIATLDDLRKTLMATKG